MRTTPPMCQPAKSFIVGNGRSVWVVLAVGLLLTSALALRLGSDAAEAEQFTLTSLCNRIENAIAGRVSDEAKSLQAAAALFRATGDISRDQWRVFTQALSLDQQLPGHLGIGFSLLVPREELPRHLRDIRSEGFPDYTLTPGGEREVYTALIYLEPFSGRNLRAFGYDMYSDPVRRAAMEQARDTGAAALSGRLTLVQETDTDRQPGAVMYFPVYRKGVPVNTVEQRRVAIYGWVSSPYRMHDLMKGTLERLGLGDGERLQLQLFDGDPPTPHSLLYDDHPAGSETRWSEARLTAQIPMDVQGQRWTLRVTRAGAGFLSVTYAGVWITITGGIAISLLLSFRTRSLVDARARAERVAEGLAKDLAEREGLLQRIVDTIPNAIFWKDAEGVFTGCNTAFASMVCCGQYQVVGKTDFDFLFPADEANAFRADDQRVISSQLPLRHIVEPLHRGDGERLWLCTTKLPLRDAGGKVVGVLGISDDITERQRVEEALLASRQRYQGLVETLSEWVWEIDLDGRFTYISPRVEHVTGWAPEDLLGKTPYDLMPPEEARRVSDMWQSLFAERTPIIGAETVTVHRAGHLVTMETSGLPFADHDGNHMGYRGTNRDVTERKIAAEALRDSEQFAMASLDALSAHIAILDYAGRILAVNRSWRAFARANSAGTAGLGEGANYLNVCTAAHGLRSDEAALFAAGFRAVACGEQEECLFEYPCHSPDEERWFMARITRFAGGQRHCMVVAHEDISSQKQARLLLQKETRIRELAARASGVGIWDLDVVHDTITWDEQMYRLYGTTRDQFGSAYQAWQAAVHPEDRQRYHEDHMRALRGEREYDVGFRVVWPDGSIRDIRSIASVQRDAAGQARHMTGTNWDVTESRKAAEQLRAATKVAEAANQAKSLFLANMSHEIRTPMNAILGFAQVLARDPVLTPEQGEHVRMITRSGSHLLHLIDDVLDLAKIESGRIVLSEASFRLRDLLDEIVLMFRARTEARGLPLLVEWDESVPHDVIGDESKLREILVNLIGNAAKFTTAGRIVVRLRAEAVTGDTAEDTGHVRLMAEVEDTGPGIPAADVGRIFGAFQQGESGAKAGGTGLGLAISSKLAAMMGGDLTVTTRVGQGSCFRFTVLLRLEAAVHEPDILASRYVVGLEPGSGPVRILLVDDSPTNLALLRALLGPVGFEMAEATNGVEALEAFERWSPHAILMDMRMPVMDGYEATRRIKSTEAGRSTSVIALTATAFDHGKEQVMAAGVDAYLRKPFQAAELLDVLRTCLDLRFRLADHTDDIPVASDLASQNAVAPVVLPQALMQAMQQAVDEGDMAVLTALIAQVDTRDGPAARLLRASADAYDYGAISRWLKKAGEHHE